MNQLNSALLINLLGFTLGIALYGLLLAMVVRHRRVRETFAPDFLLLTTAILGVLWNAGELYEFVRHDFGQETVSPFLTATAYSALGFLPSVVVHSVWKNSDNENRNRKILTILAYLLSAFAAALHFESAVFYQVAPSSLALLVLTVGSLALLAALLVFNFRQTPGRKAIWITALLVFVLSSLHLNSGEAEEKSWLVELVAHQSSLPLALAILLQDFRFAFADLFLKRALSLILVTATAFGLYLFVAAPLLHYHETHDRNDAQAITLIITLWVATALVYPFLHRFSVWLVDKILLRRIDYKNLQKQIAQEIEVEENADSILKTITDKLGAALTAKEADWRKTEGNLILQTTNYDSPDASVAEILIPTAEQPFYQIVLRDFVGGRRLLSDEIEMLENVSLLAARRIDAVRVSRERHAQEIRAQQTAKLATEAELRALRAQLNPHFLFNALTTISYLINSSPEKATETLMRLTQLLRGVLRSTGEFSTLEGELKLIESYLEIERARFEERLQIKIDVSPELRRLKIPSLILQPLVENSIKHGVSKAKKGGKVEIKARIEEQNLILVVSDTGAGASLETLIENRQSRVGLNNIEQRLQSHFGDAARFEIESEPGVGTKSKIVLPLNKSKINL